MSIAIIRDIRSSYPATPRGTIIIVGDFLAWDQSYTYNYMQTGSNNVRQMPIILILTGLNIFAYYSSIVNSLMLLNAKIMQT